MDIDQCVIAVGGPLHSEPPRLITGSLAPPALVGTTLKIVAAEGRIPRDLDVDSLIDGHDPLSATVQSDKPLIFAPGGKRTSASPAAQMARALGTQTMVTHPGLASGAQWSAARFRRSR
jgi:hypothetical protein